MLIIETVVKGTGKENAWRRKLLIIGIFKFMKGFYTKEEIKLRLLVKIVSHFLRASLCSIPHSLHVLHGRCHLYFTGDETETKGGVITCSRSHSSFVI